MGGRVLRPTFALASLFFGARDLGIQFGDCVLDPGTRELSRRGRVVAISPKAFRLLEILLERRPNAVRKEELQELLWAGLFVSDGNLARLMTEIRDAIDDEASQPRWIRTVHGFGYAFSGEVGPTAPRSDRRSTFRLIWGDRRSRCPKARTSSAATRPRSPGSTSTACRGVTRGSASAVQGRPSRTSGARTVRFSPGRRSSVRWPSGTETRFRSARFR